MVFGGGDLTNGDKVNDIQYVTIQTTSNTTDFGDLTVARFGIIGLSNGTYGTFNGGEEGASTKVNTIEYVTIATPGNATDFGDLLSTGFWGSGTSGSPS